MIWALPISLATTFGIVIYFLFLWVIRCFSSPGSPTITMDLLWCNTTLLVLSSLIRISAVQRLFATTRSFSQLVTSFFGAMYQGILLYALCSLFFINISFNLRPIQSYTSLQKKLKTNFEFIYSRINSSILLEYSFLFAFCTLFLVYISS